MLKIRQYNANFKYQEQKKKKKNSSVTAIYSKANEQR